MHVDCLALRLCCFFASPLSVAELTDENVLSICLSYVCVCLKKLIRPQTTLSIARAER